VVYTHRIAGRHHHHRGSGDDSAAYVPRSRKRWARNPCQSNLKQIGLGILMYSQDYNEKFPLVQVANSSGGVLSANRSDWVTPPFGWADAFSSM
jgi:hypothetical protein